MQLEQINWQKVDGLLPVIIQHARTLQILMLGYMNQQALEKTLAENRVTFYSRSKQRLWTKGEGSGNYLMLRDIALDCDRDALLIKAEPLGPTCHLGSASCFDKDDNAADLSVIGKLEELVDQRYNSPSKDSYTSSLFREGVSRVAQKLGEEGVEVALAAALEDNNKFANEVADLLYHLLVLMRYKNVACVEVYQILLARMKNTS